MNIKNILETLAEEGWFVAIEGPTPKEPTWDVTLDKDPIITTCSHEDLETAIEEALEEADMSINDFD